MTKHDSSERQPRDGLSMTPQDQMLGLVNNYWQATCAGAAAELQIADHLAEGPLHVDVLAQRTKTHAPSLFRMLRALECTGIFAQTSPRVFTNTPQSERLRRNLPGSQWAWIRICLCSDTAIFAGWSGLTKALRSGRTGFEEVRGGSAWEYLQAHPEEQSNFNAAMRDLSAAMTPAVAAAYDWSRFPVIADIGGGIGAQLEGILEAHPSCRGILFDQPHVVAEASPNDRIERVGGDFFTAIPVRADAYMLRWIIHDWPDDRCLTILQNIRKSAPPGARLVLVEWVIPETAAYDTGKWMDVNMMVMTSGQERTAAEFRALYERAGFELEQIVPTASPLNIIIGKARA